MVTIYHNLDPDAPAVVRDAGGGGAEYQPAWEGLELAALVSGTDDLNEAFDQVIHRDGENWTAYPGVRSFGDRRGRRSSQEGDVFVASDGVAYLVLPVGFRALPDVRLPFLP